MAWSDHRTQPGLCRCLACAQAGPPLASRRGFLAASAATAIALTTPIVAWAQTLLAPEAALTQLMDGNARFVSGRLTSFDEDLAILKQNTVSKQEPFAAVLSCSNSRVPVELVFDQSIGHVFVARVAGNICTPEVVASLEYGVAALGVAAIVVLGHSSCGAVQAAIAGKPSPGQISALYAPIRPAVQRAGPDVEAVIKANAQIQAELLRTASPVIAERVAAGKVKVVGGYYDLADGRVALLA